MSLLTFERYGLFFTVASLSNSELSAAASLDILRVPDFQMFVLLSTGLLLIAIFIGSRRMRRD